MLHGDLHITAHRHTQVTSSNVRKFRTRNYSTMKDTKHRRPRIKTNTSDTNCTHADTLPVERLKQHLQKSHSRLQSFYVRKRGWD